MEETTLQSTSPLGAAEMMGTITTIHLILIALFALAAVLIIVWGTKRWRANKQAMAELEADGRLERIDADAPVVAAEPEPAPTPAPPVERHAEPAAAAPFVAPLSEAIPQPVSVAPAAPPVIEPQAETVAPPAPVTRSGEGDLTRLKGLGPKVAARLAELNVTRIADLAALDEEQAAALDAQLGNFSGRMGRDKWIEQARLLNAGDIAGYEAQFGKLG